VGIGVQLRQQEGEFGGVQVRQQKPHGLLMQRKCTVRESLRASGCRCKLHHVLHAW
jgi:hypothetical protein